MSESLQSNDGQAEADRALMACVREINEFQPGVRYPSANMPVVWRLRGFFITMWLTGTGGHADRQKTQSIEGVHSLKITTHILNYSQYC